MEKQTKTLNGAASAAPSPPPVYLHERVCSECSSSIQASSPYPHGTSGADRALWKAAVELDWRVRLLLSGHIVFTCRVCKLKVT
jgi:hypothetical protein